MVYKQNVRNIEEKCNRLHKINLIIRNFTYYVVCILELIFIWYISNRAIKTRWATKEILVNRLKYNIDWGSETNNLKNKFTQQ